MTHTPAPDIIYLQTDGEVIDWRHVDITWCVDQINEEDTAYVRKDIADALLEACEKALDILVQLGGTDDHGSIVVPRKNWEKLGKTTIIAMQAAIAKAKGEREEG